ncbi:QRFP-like peptide receptor [Nematostella vectensis]|uniref:QRFP-like peptide receptor n=1 Tax=Nematostella vectensis TaxID=45351 RepID=UPI00138FB069|nr:QRFP-like peptide receptor [Nematostella vectensis]XP_048585670.1 QRFP-like peptide receptor [Nematostella vectensis]
MLPAGEIVLIFVLSLLMLTDLIGNTLVVIVVLRSRSLRTPMNFLLVNLAIADMMVAIFMSPRHIFLPAFTHPEGYTGDIVCKLLTGGNLMWVGGAASSFCLVAVAIERYYAILYPHLDKGRVTRSRLKVIILVCWLYAFVVDIPPFLVIFYNHDRRFCTEYWPNISLARAYTIMMFNLDFALPVVLMGALYSRVVYRLWFRQNNDTSHAQLAVARSRKKVTMMVLIVTVIFGLCWMPVLTLYMLSYHLPNDFEYASTIHNAAVVFICINSSINPFIYTFKMGGFGRELKKLLRLNKHHGLRIKVQGFTGDSHILSTTKVTPLEVRTPTCVDLQSVSDADH